MYRRTEQSQCLAKSPHATQSRINLQKYSPLPSQLNSPFWNNTGFPYPVSLGRNLIFRLLAGRVLWRRSAITPSQHTTRIQPIPTENKDRRPTAPAVLASGMGLTLPVGDIEMRSGPRTRYRRLVLHADVATLHYIGAHASGLPVREASPCKCRLAGRRHSRTRHRLSCSHA